MADMGMKLRRPWSTKRRSEPAPSVTVFLVEERGGLWYPVMESHLNCSGMTHKTCTIVERWVAQEGFTTMTAAEEALADSVKRADQKGVPS